MLSADLEPRRIPLVDRYIANMDQYRNRPRLRFPRGARRYNDSQYAILVKSPLFLNTVLLGKYGLVHSNFGLAQLVNDGMARFVQTVRRRDLSKADIELFVREIRETAVLNKWPDDMLDIELQYLRSSR
jgi:hypothetical protein